MLSTQQMIAYTVHVTVTRVDLQWQTICSHTRVDLKGIFSAVAKSLKVLDGRSCTFAKLMTTLSGLSDVTVTPLLQNHHFV